MALKFIKTQVSRKMGLDPSNPTENEVLDYFINEACRELYMQADLAGTLMEQVFKVNGDQTITLPAYVYSPRGIRELASMQVWHVNQMRPRYNQFNWKDMWRNWRIKSIQALQASITNQSVINVNATEVEDPAIIVSITGQTPSASRITEQVTLSASSVSTVNNFIDIISVSKDRTNNFDITLTDVDGKLLTTIPNNDWTSQYTIMDVSACPWLPQDTSPLDNYIELLYKPKLYPLINDNDSFPALHNYDDAIVNKTLQLWAEEQSKPELAAAYDAKATRTAARVHDDQNKETEDEIALVAHPHDTMLKRVGTGLRRRYSLYAGRKY